MTTVEFYYVSSIVNTSSLVLQILRIFLLTISILITKLLLQNECFVKCYTYLSTTNGIHIHIKKYNSLMSYGWWSLKRFKGKFLI